MNEPSTSNIVGPIRLPLEARGGAVNYFQLWYFVSPDGGRWAAAVLGDVSDGHAVPLRIESACLFGHVFGSRQCDCGFQLKEAFVRVAEQGRGIVIYGIDQDARGNGIEAHFRIYDYRQNYDLDTEEVFKRLHASLDARTYEMVPEILRHLGAQNIDLMSNNPARMELLKNDGFHVRHVPLEAAIDRYNMATMMLEKEDLPYSFSFATHGDWLRGIQSKVDGMPERRAGCIVRDNAEIVADWEGDGTAVAEHLTASLPRTSPPSERLVAYLSDLPRKAEIKLYAEVGAAFVVVPFATLPQVLVEEARAHGVKLQDWGRSNAYAQPRPQLILE
ncbi:hypothetical protein [Achromobacter sp. JUb104]|uniref:hypothetical protein n=1 Tax=Achromobacter sp. JUb104 TaxID=2940590 RepID=UPI00216724F4|nr:hypothetical protein [Achromobacter sp. JUb104]MCS3509318.1 GTP cyclohydrolase II [Achromobacter sp. JUb104]